ncbi:hypothetical protein [Sphingomonas lacusdianchii]|uniref:hypothetical protein n=1 Tax=Sphingomonas lacusdianchii TaxID=2917992 RepID=UPI001F56EC85|nr:hypothetical protein [Sphingomonas sp. JXJ CY 53]
MTFGRALITALLAGGLSHAQTGDTVLQMVAVWFIAWQFTSDPLPDAIHKGLNDFAKEHRR